MSGIPEEPDLAGLEEGEGQQAEDIVPAVVAWYAKQIATERRSPLPDEDRIAQLNADRAVAYADLESLETADTEEEDRIAALWCLPAA